MDFQTDLLLLQLLTKVQEIKSMGSQFADIGPDMWLIQVLVDFNIRVRCFREERDVSATLVGMLGGGEPCLAGPSFLCPNSPLQLLHPTHHSLLNPMQPSNAT